MSLGGLFAGGGSGMAAAASILGVFLRVALFVAVAVLMMMPALKKAATFGFCGIASVLNVISLVQYATMLGKDIIPDRMLIFHIILPTLLFLTILGLLIAAELGILPGKLAMGGIVGIVVLNLLLLFLGGRQPILSLLFSNITLSLVFVLPLSKAE